MQHNILLLFLSDVKVTRDGKKLAEPADYPGLGHTMTTNESAVRYLVQKHGRNTDAIKLDKIFAFATNKIRKLYVGQKSVEDETWAADAVDEQGSPLTHLAYFKYRLRTEGLIKDIDSCMTEDSSDTEIDGTVCPFNEDSEDVKQTMMTIAGMAKRILGYIQTLPKEEQNDVILHADMTGGFRHASMMMLAVMRLMQYQGVKIGHVLYSNFDSDTKKGTVQEVEDIYHMFDLVAGAEEFVRFGSVNAIGRYFFKNNRNGAITPNLENLIQAMDNFAEAIKLTRRSNFNSAIAQLNESISGFQPDAGNLNDTLMNLLQKRIQGDYQKLFDNDGLTPIEWCLNHDYVQQALMLYTESVPPFLFENNILRMDDESEESVNKAKGTDRSDLHVYLFNNYKPNLRKLAFHNQKPIVDAVSEFLSLLQDKEINKAAVKAADVKKIIADLGVGRRDAVNCGNVMNALLEIADKPELEISSGDKEMEFIAVLLKKYVKEGQNKKVNSVLKEVANDVKMKKSSKNANAFNTIMDLLCYEKPEKKFDEQIKKQYGLHMERFRVANVYNLFYQQVISINEKVEERDVYETLQLYFDIKDTRNDSAHANINVGNSVIKTSEELKEYMEKGIEMLRKMRDQVS